MPSIKLKACVVLLFIVLPAVSGCNGIQIGIESPVGETTPGSEATNVPVVSLPQPDLTPSLTSVLPTTTVTPPPTDSAIPASSCGWRNIGLEGVLVNDLAIDPWTLTTLYAGTDRGVFKSTDKGMTWREINIGLTDTHVLSLAIDPTTDPAAPNTLCAGTHDGGVYKSVDGGESWSDANIGLIVTGVHGLAIDPAPPATIYAATQAGMFKSIDGGTN